MHHKASLLCLALWIIASSDGVSVEKDLTLTETQAKILDQFKERMRPYLTEEYMVESIYLVRWLRARNFNMDAAERMLRNNLKWRKDNNIDNLDMEDWSYFEEEFAYNVDTLDKNDKPIITIDSVKWDVRQAVISGQRERLGRWMIKMMEDATRRVRELQREGRNVTRWGIIFNLGYFNLIQSGCLQCLSVYTEFMENYELRFPGTVDRIILVNTPGIFEVVLRAIRQVLSPETRDTLQVYSTNKMEWQQALLKDIPRDNLPEEYGGTKRRLNID